MYRVNFLSRSGNIPVQNYLLKISDRGLDIRWDICLKILVGMLFGPTPLEESKSLIISSISDDPFGLSRI